MKGTESQNTNTELETLDKGALLQFEPIQFSDNQNIVDQKLYDEIFDDETDGLYAEMWIEDHIDSINQPLTSDGRTILHLAVLAIKCIFSTLFGRYNKR